MTSYILITGVTGGLGSAFVIECAKRGFPIFLTDVSEAGYRFANYLSENYHIETRFKSCDLTSPDKRKEFYDYLQMENIQFRGLINVAGVDYEGEFLTRSRDQILTILNLNVVSTVDTTQAILRLRDESTHFMLINVCSLAAISPMPYKAIYAATKRFLLDFSLAIREEIKPFGSVTALCPAGMPTTNENMRAIFAQGFWGQVTTLNTDVVARITLQAALKGRPIVVPGILNSFIRWMAGWLPVSVSARLVANRWRLAQQQNLIQPWRQDYPLLDEGVPG